jgi:hypothetical protein
MSPKAPTVGTLQTLSAVEEDDRYAQVAKEAGFSLHAGVAAQAWERDKLERLCRYISRPGVSEKRLSLTSAGNIRYQLKTPYSESWPHERSECFGSGTTHVVAPAHPALATLVHPCTSYSIPWTSSQSWPLLYQSRRSTSQDFTVYSSGCRII